MFEEMNLNHISELYELNSFLQTSDSRCKNSKIYSNQECIEDVINNKEPFLCLHEAISDKNTVQRIFLSLKMQTMFITESILHVMMTMVNINVVNGILKLRSNMKKTLMNYVQNIMLNVLKMLV